MIKKKMVDGESYSDTTKELLNPPDTKNKIDDFTYMMYPEQVKS